MKHLRTTALAAAALFAVSGPQAFAQQATMTKADFVRYYELFTKGDERYADLLADDIVFPHMSGKVFHGKAEVLAYYRGIKDTGYKETREPTTIVIDNENGTAAVELTFHIWAEPGTNPKLPSGEEIHPGEMWEGHSVLFYTTRGNKITGIRGSLSGPGKVVRVK